jgi:hypothetical protein
MGGDKKRQKQREREREREIHDKICTLRACACDLLPPPTRVHFLIVHSAMNSSID